MNQKKPMPQAVRTAITAVNIVLVTLGILVMIFLTAGIAGAKSSGTFSLFGKSFHLNQSEQMSPLIEKNDLIIIRNSPPTSFQMGDLIAYRYEENGQDYLIIRKLAGMVGTEYYLEDGAGVQTTVDAEKTEFLGTVESRSPQLGYAVRYLHSKEGRKIFFWWTGGILFFLTGVSILLHVILKNAGQHDSDEPDTSHYGVNYLDSDTLRKPEPLREQTIPGTVTQTYRPASDYRPRDEQQTEPDYNDVFHQTVFHDNKKSAEQSTPDFQFSEQQTESPSFLDQALLDEMFAEKTVPASSMMDQPVPKKAEDISCSADSSSDSDFEDAFASIKSELNMEKNVSADTSPAPVSGSVSSETSADDALDLNDIISNIQARLDEEDKDS